MATDVWMSGLIGLQSVGDKQGLQDKYFGVEWRPAQHEIPLHSEKVKHSYKKHWRGLPLERSDFPEALAVFDDERFRLVGDLFMAGPFYAVKGKLADVFSRFDLGDGGLIPFPIYREDKCNLVDDNFFLLNFGGPKDSLLPEGCRNIDPFYWDDAAKRQIWIAKAGVKDDDIILSSSALDGSDIWAEEALYKKIFMSGELVDAISKLEIDLDLELQRCRILN